MPWISLKDSQRGTVLVESALVLPIIMILTIGVIDMTRLLNCYSLLNRTVYEGVRYAGGVPALSGGETSTDNLTGANAGHLTVMNRVQQLLVLNNLQERTSKISSQLCKRTSGGGAVQRVVSVRISYRFQPMFLSTEIPIVVQDDGPYLFQDATTTTECVNT